ncbi:MAG: MAPEG family protein [Woeseiaceae bacterium]|nr:MAPEG family protein [Woeseiaceae bacterium]
MTTELTMLTWVAAFTAVLWIPYILNMIMVRGLADAVGYPENPKPLAPWATRMKAAHYNAVENLVVFSALILTLHAAGISTDLTARAAVVYFWARVAHFFVYGFGIPWLRTITFAIAWASIVTLILELLL